jgi:hypothetical protein
MQTVVLDKPKRTVSRRVVLKVEEPDGDSREEIIANLKEAAKELKLIKAGKLHGRPARELLNEL